MITNDNIPSVKSIKDWHENVGDALWWPQMELASQESPHYVGSPLCSDWPYSKMLDPVWIPLPKYRVD